MVTLVGIQNDVMDMLADMIELEYDAIEAYNAAISRLENKDYQQNFRDFKADHERHIKDLAPFLRQVGKEVPTGPSAKQWLTKGKVVLADMLGDNTILSAMRTNEDDTNTAYERAVNHKDMPVDLRETLKRALADERRHRDWIIATLKMQK